MGWTGLGDASATAGSFHIVGLERTAGGQRIELDEPFLYRYDKGGEFSTSYQERDNHAHSLRTFLHCSAGPRL